MTTLPSGRAATELGIDFPGLMMQPIQPTCGPPSSMAISNTSIDSRPPWLTT